jgi:hypothetical protein
VEFFQVLGESLCRLRYLSLSGVELSAQQGQHLHKFYLLTCICDVPERVPIGWEGGWFAYEVFLKLGR